MFLQTINNEPRVSHRIIATNTDNSTKSIYRLLRDNKPDFEEFGALRFKIEGVVNNGKGAQPKTYYLNEPQATLLLTYLRNSDIVKKFKKALVKEFYLLKGNSLHVKDKLQDVLEDLHAKSTEADTYKQKYYESLEKQNYLLAQMVEDKEREIMDADKRIEIARLKCDELEKRVPNADDEVVIVNRPPKGARLYTGTGKPFREDELATALELYNKGVSYSAIGRALGRAASTITRNLQKRRLV